MIEKHYMELFIQAFIIHLSLFKRSLTRFFTDLIDIGFDSFLEL